MPNIVRIPITNTINDGDYTAEIIVGAKKTKVAVVLDTGSSSLAVESKIFDPTGDAATKTTNVAQAIPYGSGSWVGAVVDTQIALSDAVTLSNVNLSVVYTELRGVFGGAHGIFGLAYQPLNSSYLMPANTWTNKYPHARVVSGEEHDLDPYFDQLENAGIVSNIFAFRTKRSMVSHATDDPAGDPLNQGYFLLGGGPEADDLYSGAFVDVAILHDKWYSANLIAARVGDQAPVKALPLPPGSNWDATSVIDNGTNSLFLDQTLFDGLMTAFGKIDPSFPDLLRQYSQNSAQTCDQGQIDLAKWPPITFTLQGIDGSPCDLTVGPKSYWQFDVTQKGRAMACIVGDGNSSGGESILGLPLLAEYYTVFDRNLNGGRGAVRFAKPK